jgi:hypothetical protein
MAENNLDKSLAFLGTSLHILVTQASGLVDLNREKGSILANNLGRIK